MDHISRLPLEDKAGSSKIVGINGLRRFVLWLLSREVGAWGFSNANGGI
jgi:hypothetical protein